MSEIVKGVEEHEVNALDILANANGYPFQIFKAKFKELAEKHSRKVLEDFIADHFPEDSKVSTTYAGKYEYTIPKREVDWAADLGPEWKSLDEIRKMYGDRFANGFGSLRTDTASVTASTTESVPDVVIPSVTQSVFEGITPSTTISGSGSKDKQQYGRVYSDLEPQDVYKGYSAKPSSEHLLFTKSNMDKPDPRPTDLDEHGCNAEGCYAWGEFLKGVKFVDGGYQWKQQKTEVPRETKYKNGDLIYTFSGKVNKLRIVKAKDGEYEAMNLYDTLYFNDKDNNRIFKSRQELVDFITKSAESL